MTDLGLELFLLLCSLALLVGMSVGVAALARIRELERAGYARREPAVDPVAGHPADRVADIAA